MAIGRDVFAREVMALLPRLLGVARRLTRNDEDAEDLVAESVTRAWRALPTLECDAALRGWLFRILHNTFISECRRNQARPATEPLDPDAEDDDEPPFWLFERMHQPFLLWFSHPEQAFLDKLLREDIENALAALPPHHRMVVVLADVEELGYAEIAQALDVPLGTVRSRLARGRAALQKLLWRQAQDAGLAAAAAARPAAFGTGGAHDPA
ncbi:sigma-70 family RNA polymerase sigma factor [Ramlibacter sp.]|uniref:sigma-70 family RNA polymerase sigma factor n=1 Tax=Ramlibacter sp. TaxID=1917967 RepID=UPI002FC94CDB